MAGKRSKHKEERSEKPHTKRAWGGGKREACGGPHEERGRCADYQRTGQHTATGGHQVN